MLGFWHLRAVPLGSGVSDPIPVFLVRCPWLWAFGSRLSLFGDRFSAFGYRHCDLGSWLWALISGLGALGFRPWDMVSRVLGQGSGLLASVASLAVESSPRSKITYNNFVKLLGFVCSEATRFFAQKVPNLKRKSASFGPLGF